MKKLLLSILSISALTSLNAQTVVNGTFEAAVTHPYAPTLPEIGVTTGWGLGVFDAETAAPFAGTQSLKLTSINNANISGALGFSSDSVTGFAVQTIDGPVSNPEALLLKATFKYTPVNGDVGMIAVEIYDTLLAGFNDDVVLFAGYAEISAGVATYTSINLPVTAITGATGTANQVYMYALSSAGGFYPSEFVAPRPGSTLWIDNVSIASALSVEENVISASVFPNPANNVLNISTSEEVANVSITTMDGKAVASSTTSSVDVEALSTGMYIYTVTTVSGKVANGTFAKN